MFKSFVIAAAIASVAGTKIVDEDHKTRAVTQSMVDEINAMRTTWKAEVSTRFANATIADVKMLLGTVLPGEAGFYEPELEKTTFTVASSTIPKSFDARTNWSKCSNVIGRVRDQSNCGSCWAFGSTEAFNDRYCIHTGDNTKVFSPEDTVSCCSGMHCKMSMGCNGGQPSGAWDWFTKTGVSTGADWAQMNTGETCKPYSMQSCAHHVAPPAGMVACDTLPSYDTPKCTSSCNDAKYKTAYSSDKVKAATSYTVKGVENMQKELMEKGTLSVSFTVYEDFEAYSTGVYKHVSGKSLGGHAIKMIGWGEEADGTPYWICVNSWNESWGEKGLFRILRGTNECGIEGGVVAGSF
jgi:cathepsin B